MYWTYAATLWVGATTGGLPLQNARNLDGMRKS